MNINTISSSNGYDELNGSNYKVTTDEARDRLEDTVFSTLESAENTLIDADTSTGKSYLIATTPWLEYPEITGGNLVIHIHQTTDARDEAVEESKSAEEVTWEVYKGRQDACPTAAGDHDDTHTAPYGLTPSGWFKRMCDVRKNGFLKAHNRLSQSCDMPCEEHGRCRSVTQWWKDIHDEDRNPTVDVVHTTANFAHVPELIEGANLIFDERPDYALTLGNDERQQIRDSVSGLLEYRSKGECAVSDVTTVSRKDDSESAQELRELLDGEISEDWYFRRQETHRLAPEIGRAILDAKEIIENQWAGDEIDFSGRRMGEYEGVRVVINSNGKIRHVQHTPDLSDARCVIGLDAFPSIYRWRLNTVDDLSHEQVLSPEQRRYWRREERGLKIVQVGSDTRAYTQGWNGAGKERAAGLIDALRRKHGDAFQTCITANSIEDDILRFMRDAGIISPQTMHFGGQNSRNDFMDELFGAVLGCIDPGDKNILDLLALGGHRAWPVLNISENGEKKRETGRTFEGPASDIAVELLSSVREANLAQAAGRYARKPESSESSATVYVWSDACPSSLVDEKLGISYCRLTKKRRNIIESLQESHGTRREIEEETGIDKSYIHECLELFHECNLISKNKGAGKYGATEWKWDVMCRLETDSKTLVQLED